MSVEDNYYIGDEEDEYTVHAARRERSEVDQRKSKAEEKRKPLERILARLEANKKEEDIKSTGHCTDFVLEKNYAKQRNQQHKQKFKTQISQNHLA